MPTSMEPITDDELDRVFGGFPTEELFGAYSYMAAADDWETRKLWDDDWLAPV